MKENISISKNKPLDLENGKSIVCKFLLKRNEKASKQQLKIWDFVIRKEHSFLTIPFTFRFVELIVQDFENITDNDLLEFGQSHYEFDSLDKMFDEVKKTDIKRQKTKYQNKYGK